MPETVPKRSSNFQQVAAAETNDADRFVKPLLVDPSTGRLLVDASVTVSGLATAVTDGEAVDAADTGNLAMGTDGSNYQIIHTDSSGDLQIDVLTMPTVAVTGTFWQATQPVSLTSTTVTGTVAVTQSGTWDEVGINDSGNSITVDNGGTFATQVDGAALTALQLIDNSIYVDDADWTADTSSHTLIGAVTQTAPTANTDGDTTPLITNNLRELRNAALESDLATAGTSHVKKYYTNSGAVTDGIIWSPAAGKRWFVTMLAINVSAAATVTIEDDLGAGDSAVYKAEFAANSGVVLTFPEVPMFSGEDAADLLVTTTAGNVYITCVGYEI